MSHADAPPRHILILVADQLAQAAMGCYGDPQQATPTLDRLAERGVRFGQAYCNYPLCGPSRPSFWTGLYPHQTGVLSNGRHWPNPEVPETVPSLGSLFRAAGWRTVHFGKTHDYGALRGFEVVPVDQEPLDGPDWAPHNVDTFRDVDTTAKCVEFLSDYPDDHRLLMVADLLNPHNICGFVGANAGPENQLPLPAGDLPPLPDNFEVEDMAKRPKPVQYVCCAHRRLMQAAHWSPTQYRQYLAAYYHYTRLMDQCVGRILDALEQRGIADRTLIVFFSDHGDGMARHRMVTKHTTFYDEVTRVPWLFAGPGVTARDLARHEPDADGHDQPLVSLLDLVPTLCDVAGIDPPPGLPGRSLAGYLRGDPPPADRRHPCVVSQWHTEWGFTVEPGRMLRTQRYKYTRYREDEGEELYDLAADPGETRTLIDDPAYADVLAEHRRRFGEYLAATDDPFETLEWKADPRWRSHAPGYPHHTDGCAPTVEGEVPPG